MKPSPQPCSPLFLLFVCSWWRYGFDVFETESCSVIQADLLCLSLPCVFELLACVVHLQLIIHLLMAV